MYPVRLTESHFPAQTDDAIRDETLGEALTNIARANPDAAALIEVTEAGQIGRRWSYSRLLADAERLALALSTRFDKGERVAVWSPNSPEWVITEYALALAGIVMVTVNPGYQARELKYVLEQSEAAAVFFIDSYRGNPMGEIARSVAAEIPGIRETCMMEDHDQLFASGDKPAETREVVWSDPLMIQYTSGTTGFPKGAVLNHRSMVNNARLVMKRAGEIGPNWFNFMPMFHTGGSGLITMGCMHAAGCLYICRVFEPVSLLRRMVAERCNYMLGVPTMLIALCEVQEREQLDTSSIEMCISGGAMVAPELVRRVQRNFGCGFEIVYGQTETAPVITQSAADDTLDDICNSVGQPLPCTAISIRSTETNEVVPCGTVGEICASGYCNMNGYYNKPEATAEAIDAEGWLHTGDLGTMDDRGYVAVTGRVKEMIIRGGENLFPAEIENTLLEHPAVADVAVVGLPDERWGEIVAAFVRAAGGRDLLPADLKSFCRERLAAQKTPVRWISVQSFPLTGSGKVQKFLLQEMYARGEFEEL